MIILAYLTIGLMAGVLSGLLGSGGGSIVVPALTVVYHYWSISPELAMHLAVGTSLASMVVTVLASVTYYFRKRMIDWHLLRQLYPGVILGTIAGAILAHYMHTQMLKILFGLLLLFLAFRELFGRNGPGRGELPSDNILILVSVVMGGITGLLGVGGGASCLPFLLYCNVPLRKATGVTAAVSLLAAFVGAISVMITGDDIPGLPPHSTGYVHWPAFFGIVAMSPVAAPLGARLGQVLPVVTLRRIFAGLLLIIGLEMIL